MLPARADLDILRTVFVLSGGRILQVVLRSLRPVFNIFETDDQQTVEDFTKELWHRDNGGVFGEPFVQFSVIKQRHSTRHRILLRISHAQYDGVCFPKILGTPTSAVSGREGPTSTAILRQLSPCLGRRANGGALTSIGGSYSQAHP